MTIQEKIEKLTTYLSLISDDEKERLRVLLEEAKKYFIKGDISKLAPELVKPTYEQWDQILDTKLRLYETL